jgi:hypothetical protein
MNIDQTVNARYGKIVLVSYAALNGLLLIVVCAGSWFLAARANGHGIAPNTSLGFRSQHTLASCTDGTSHRGSDSDLPRSLTPSLNRGVRDRRSGIIRRSNPMWILIVHAIGGRAVAGCFMIAGRYADKAAISVETPAVFGVEPLSLKFRFQATSIVFTRSYPGPPAQTSAGDDFTDHAQQQDRALANLLRIGPTCP